MPPKNRDIRRRLAQDGWHIARQRGSHEIWKHPVKGNTVVAGHDNEEPPAGTLKAILRAMGRDRI